MSIFVALQFGDTIFGFTALDFRLIGNDIEAEITNLTATSQVGFMMRSGNLGSTGAPLLTSETGTIDTTVDQELKAFVVLDPGDLRGICGLQSTDSNDISTGSTVVGINDTSDLGGLTFTPPSQDHMLFRSHEIEICTGLGGCSMLSSRREDSEIQDVPEPQVMFTRTIVGGSLGETGKLIVRMFFLGERGGASDCPQDPNALTCTEYNGTEEIWTIKNFCGLIVDSCDPSENLDGMAWIEITYKNVALGHAVSGPVFFVPIGSVDRTHFTGYGAIYDAHEKKLTLAKWVHQSLVTIPIQEGNTEPGLMSINVKLLFDDVIRLTRRQSDDRIQVLINDVVRMSVIDPLMFEGNDIPYTYRGVGVIGVGETPDPGLFESRRLNDPLALENCAAPPPIPIIPRQRWCCLNTQCAEYEGYVGTGCCTSGVGTTLRIDCCSALGCLIQCAQLHNPTGALIQAGALLKACGGFPPYTWSSSSNGTVSVPGVFSVPVITTNEPVLVVYDDPTVNSDLIVNCTVGFAAVSGTITVGVSCSECPGKLNAFPPTTDGGAPDLDYSIFPAPGYKYIPAKDCSGAPCGNDGYTVFRNIGWLIDHDVNDILMYCGLIDHTETNLVAAVRDNDIWAAPQHCFGTGSDRYCIHFYPVTSYEYNITQGCSQPDQVCYEPDPVCLEAPDVIIVTVRDSTNQQVSISIPVSVVD